jgi:hypothetical protein
MLAFKIKMADMNDSYSNFVMESHKTFRHILSRRSWQIHPFGRTDRPTDTFEIIHAFNSIKTLLKYPQNIFIRLFILEQIVNCGYNREGCKTSWPLVRYYYLDIRLKKLRGKIIGTACLRPGFEPSPSTM